MSAFPAFAHTGTPQDQGRRTAAMTSGAGFGETIHSVNGALECNGNNPAGMQDRINLYRQFTQILGATTGNTVACSTRTPCHLP